MKTSIYYEARLNKNITRSLYGANVGYRKGRVIKKWSESEFNELNDKNLICQTNFSICEGHGVHQYFTLNEDIDIVKVEKSIVTTIKEEMVKIKK